MARFRDARNVTLKAAWTSFHSQPGCWRKKPSKGDCPFIRRPLILFPRSPGAARLTRAVGMWFSCCARLCMATDPATRQRTDNLQLGQGKTTHKDAVADCSMSCRSTAAELRAAPPSMNSNANHTHLRAESNLGRASSQAQTRMRQKRSSNS